MSLTTRLVAPDPNRSLDVTNSVLQFILSKFCYSLRYTMCNCKHPSWDAFLAHFALGRKNVKAASPKYQALAFSLIT